jgi:hypothetical protein
MVIGLCPLAVLLGLYAGNVPLGQPHFILRYSPLLYSRMGRAAVGLLIGLLGIGAFYSALSAHGRRRVPLATLAVLMFAALVSWTFFAPPGAVNQHSFNLLSPSHEGAFVLEAGGVESIREYVSHTFFERLSKTPEEMRGRRVLSNPPGVTVTSALFNRLVENNPRLGAFLVRAFGFDVLEPDQQTTLASAMVLAMLMTGLWGVSIAFGYALCRMWMPPAASAMVAFASVFNPATVNYTPGKDCLQLFTTLAILCFWCIAYVRKRRVPGVLAGVATTISLLIGLVHAWIVLIIAAVTLWDALRRGALRTWWRCCCPPFLVGVAGTSAALYLAADGNVFVTVYRVAVRYNQIQLPIITDPLYWTLVGLPLFILFAGSHVWVLAAAIPRDRTDEPAFLGGSMLLATGVVMAYSYFFANNSETVRLWIPFVPLLSVGLALRRSPFRVDDRESRVTCVTMSAIQLVVTLAMWALMDVRESEWRLLTGRMWS